MELVLDDLDDLLLVGRLLLPVKAIIGGITAAGGTYTKRRIVGFVLLNIYSCYFYRRR